jgi:hypothetical protein
MRYLYARQRTVIPVLLHAVGQSRLGQLNGRWVGGPDLCQIVRGTPGSISTSDRASGTFRPSSAEHPPVDHLSFPS